MSEKSTNQKKKRAHVKISATLTSAETEFIQIIRKNPAIAEKVKNFLSENEIDKKSD